MKLLLDENISFKLSLQLQSLFPDSKHVGDLGLYGATDSELWDLAKYHGFTIVSKDDDFRQKAFLYGAPPKVVLLLVGNCSTKSIFRLLESHVENIKSFIVDTEVSLLILPSEA